MAHKESICLFYARTLWREEKNALSNCIYIVQGEIPECEWFYKIIGWGTKPSFQSKKLQLETPCSLHLFQASISNFLPRYLCIWRLKLFSKLDIKVLARKILFPSFVPTCTLKFGWSIVDCVKISISWFEREFHDRCIHWVWMRSRMRTMVTASHWSL